MWAPYFKKHKAEPKKHAIKISKPCIVRKRTILTQKQLVKACRWARRWAGSPATARWRSGTGRTVGPGPGRRRWAASAKRCAGRASWASWTPGRRSTWPPWSFCRSCRVVAGVFGPAPAAAAPATRPRPSWSRRRPETAASLRHSVWETWARIPGLRQTKFILLYETSNSTYFEK